MLVYLLYILTSTQQTCNKFLEQKEITLCSLIKLAICKQICAKPKSTHSSECRNTCLTRPVQSIKLNDFHHVRLLNSLEMNESSPTDISLANLFSYNIFLHFSFKSQGKR